MPTIEIGKNKIISENEKKLTKEDRERIGAELLSEDRNFPNFIKAYLDYTKHQESTKKIHKWVAVSIIAAALERKVSIDAGHFRVYPNFFIFIIGGSGSIRKSTSTAIGVKLARAAGSIYLTSEKITDRSIVDQLQKSTKEIFLDAEKGEYLRMSAAYSYAPELINYLKESSGPIMKFLTEIWDCPSPAWTYETHADGVIEVPHPCLNILGASTPSWLQRSIPSEEMEGGFASRVVFVVEDKPSEQYNPFGVPKEFRKIMKELKPLLVKDLRRISFIKGEFSFSPDAEEFWEPWYINHCKNTKSIEDIRFMGYYARKPITAWKLAMVLSVSESDQLLIERRHLEEALKWLNDLEVTMLSAFGAIGNNYLVKGMKEVFDIVKKHGSGVNQNTATRGLIKDFNMRDVGEIISTLALHDYCRLKVIGPNTMLFPGKNEL